MRVALLVAALVGACASPQALPPPELPQRAGVDPLVEARADGVVFRAVGAAPAFVLHIHRNDAMLVLTWDANQETFHEVRTVLPAYRGKIYEAQNERHAVRVAIRSGPCSDPRLEPETFSSTVTVWINDEIYRGCGREL